MPASRYDHAMHSVSNRGGARTIVIACLVLAAVVIIGVWSVGNGDSSVNVQSAVDMHKVEQTTFDISVVANGELEAKNQTEIRSELESRSEIAELVDEGIRVKEGDLLVQLNSEQIENQIDERTLQVESSKSELISAENAYEIQLSDNESALSKARLNLELAEIELKKWTEGDLYKKREELRLAIENGKRRMEQAQEKFADSELLEPKGFVSTDELREDEIKMIEAKAAYETAQLNQEVYEKYERVKQEKTLNSEVEQTLAELDRVQRKNASHLANAEARRTNRRRQLAIHEEKLAELETQLKACTILAPTDGLVVYGTSIGNGRGRMMFGGNGPLQVGQEVHPNQLLMVLPDTSEMVAAVRVHESYAGRVKPGMSAVISCDAAQGLTFTGTIASIGVLAESGGWRDPNLREYTVKIDLDEIEDESKLKPSMRAEARIVLGNVNDAIAVPIQAVFQEGRSSYVYCPKGSKFARTEVKVGRRSSTFAQIVKGLDAGDTVLLREPTPGEVFRDKDADDSDNASDSAVAETGQPKPGARMVSDTAGSKPSRKGGHSSAGNE